MGLWRLHEHLRVPHGSCAHPPHHRRRWHRWQDRVFGDVGLLSQDHQDRGRVGPVQRRSVLHLHHHAVPGRLLCQLRHHQELHQGCCQGHPHRRLHRQHPCWCLCWCLCSDTH